MACILEKRSLEWVCRDERVIIVNTVAFFCGLLGPDQSPVADIQ